MNPVPYKPVSEDEIIDVLLGDADPALEARVRQAIRHDMKAAALYAQWSRVIPAVQHAAQPLRRMNERVRDTVMKRLAEAPLAGAQYFVGDVVLVHPRRFAWPGWLRGRSLVMAAASLLFLILAVPAAWRWMNPYLVAESVSGDLLATRGAGGPPALLLPGSRVRLPVRLASAPGARAELRLADGSSLKIDGAADLSVEGRRRVIQTAGSATYQVAARRLAGNFTVQLPSGKVEDLGTAFGVTVRGERGALVRVDDGRVRVSPRQGAPAEARAGERALFDDTGVIVEPIPAHRDLARARAQHPTRLTRHTPISGTVTEIPPGAREMTYQSGPLALKAWFFPGSADAPRRQPKSNSPLAPRPSSFAPVVVYLHDGHALTPANWAATEPWRRAGFIVMAPALRGENGNPGACELLWGEVDDAVAAGRAAAALPGVDPARIYLAGSGLGGTLALLVAMVPSPYAAACAIEPICDPAVLFEAPPFDPTDATERLLRTPAAFPDSLRIPLRIACAEGPGAEPARRLARAAALLGKDCQLLPATSEAALAFFTETQ